MTDNNNETWYSIPVILPDGKPGTKRVKTLEIIRKFIEWQQQNTNLSQKLEKLEQEVLTIVESKKI